MNIKYIRLADTLYEKNEQL